MHVEVAMPAQAPTNAASSGVTLDRKTLKAIARRSDSPGLVYLAQWGTGLLVTGSFVWLSLGSWWLWPAMFVHSVLLSVPVYAISHETAHGTAFRSHWLNETVMWLSSLIYFEEPLHRRYTHTNHHIFTWHVGKDSQMPFDTPLTLGGWLLEVSGFALMRFHAAVMLRLASGPYSDMMKRAAPHDELRKMSRNAWVFLAVYTAVGLAIALGVHWPAWFLMTKRISSAGITMGVRS